MRSRPSNEDLMMPGNNQVNNHRGDTNMLFSIAENQEEEKEEDELLP